MYKSDLVKQMKGNDSVNLMNSQVVKAIFKPLLVKIFKQSPK